MRFDNKDFYTGLPGIYRISDRTGRSYIGSTNDLRARFRNHRHTLRHREHRNQRLQDAWIIYGENSFTFEVLLVCADESLLLAFEQKFLDHFKPEYNAARIAGSAQGMKRSEETRRKISESKKGQPSPRKGVTLSEETKRKISDSKKKSYAKRRIVPLTNAERVRRHKEKKKMAKNAIINFPITQKG